MMQNANNPSPELAGRVSRMILSLNEDQLLKKINADPALKALHIQTLNHLQHISYDFRIENATYPHRLALKGAYPYEPTLRAIGKSLDFFVIAEAAGLTAAKCITPSKTKEELRKEQRSLITSNPIRHYEDYKSRLEAQGREAQFPEFGSVVEFLTLEMFENQDVLALTRQNRHMDEFRHIVIKQLGFARKSNYAYMKTIYAIERAVEFFDIVQRVQHPDRSPKLYHSYRYEYYMHYLTTEIPEHILFPTIVSLGVTDLLKTRGVPIGFIGINTEIERVDSFNQTPYEFFIHDVNHSRRMFQFGKEEAERQSIRPAEFYRRTNEYMQQRWFCLKSCMRMRSRLTLR